MNIDLVIPCRQAVPLESLVRTLSGQRIERDPFTPELLDAFGRISRAIFESREAARYPEIVALAYWLRPAELNRMRREFLDAVPSSTVLAPRGRVFHVPPGNVDTIFVYSFVLSALMGNANIVRLSQRATPQAEILVNLLAHQFSSGSALENLLHVVRYGHETEITDALTSVSDCRVIWGGDHTVREIRKSPLPPHAIELVFPDRYSLAAIDIGAYLALPAKERASLASDFFNDAFWFDQLACSSPRVVVWCGSGELLRQAQTEFWSCLDEELARRAWEPQPAAGIRRLQFGCEQASDGQLTTYEHRRAYSRLAIPSLAGLGFEHCGGGAFFETRLDSLEDLIPHVDRRHQTLSTYGFDRERLRSFGSLLRARGIDRIVPIGQALKFGRYWDGYDLLLSFGRHIQIGEVSQRGA